MSEKNFYTFTEDDFLTVLNFVKNYHLEPTKGSRDRTTGTKRDFGGEMDAFIPGKLLELGVSRIIEKYKKDIKLKTDENIYTDKEIQEKADPDITKVIKSQIARDPKLYIEVKKDQKNWGWIGMPVSQLNTIEEKRGKKTLDNMFIVYPEIIFSDNKNKKEQNILGSILKKFFASNIVNFNEFSSIGNIHCKINTIFSINDLRKHGHIFKKGNIIPMESFEETINAYNQPDNKGKRSVSGWYKLEKKYPRGLYNLDIQIKNAQIVKFKIDNSEIFPFFSKFKVDGDFEILTNKKKDRHIYSKSITTMENEFFGKIVLEKDTTHRFFFESTLEVGLKNKDDWWLLKNRLDQLIDEKNIKTVEENLQYIANNI